MEVFGEMTALFSHSPCVRHQIRGRAMRRRDCIALLAAAMTGLSLAAHAQSRDDAMRRIGLLMAGSGRRAEAYVASFVESLDALGWHEGRNLRIELR